MKPFLTELEAIQKLKVPRSSRQNGVAEKLNPHLLHPSCSIVRQKKESRELWAKALKVAVQVHNLVTAECIAQLHKPHETMHPFTYRARHFRVFGSRCCNKVTKESTSMPFLHLSEALLMR